MEAIENIDGSSSLITLDVAFLRCASTCQDKSLAISRLRGAAGVKESVSTRWRRSSNIAEADFVIIQSVGYPGVDQYNHILTHQSGGYRLEAT